MKIFGWIQSKLTYGRHDESNHKPNSKMFDTVSEPYEEEVNDWLYGLLAIGTFGKNDIKEDLERTDFHDNIPTSQDLVSEEVGNLQDNFDSLWHKQDDLTYSASASELQQVLPLQIQSSDNAQCSDEPSTKSASLQLGTSIVLRRGKDVCVDNKRNDIGKKSLSFLLKKILVCRSGFSLPPSLKAPFPESRTEKILRATLHKKIYPQKPSPSLPARKYLENRNMALSNSNEDGMTEKAKKGSQWVKTDSEYIVLEM